MSNFKVGSKVKWQSSAAGSWTEKQGIVVAIIPATADVRREIDTRVKAGTHRSNYGFGMPRDHESYLVEVRQSMKGKAILYWPVVSRLQRT